MHATPIDAQPETPAPASGVVIASAITLLALGAWQFYAGATVNIDTWDGYDTIVNARYFLGDSAQYRVLRAPLMSLLIAPAEWVKQQGDFHPLDVRPHHLLMAFVHVVYWLIVFRLLVSLFGLSWAVLLAFLACVPSFMFFSYGSFLSHDFFPGAMLLGMLVLSDRFVTKPALGVWLALVAIGAAAALTKHVLGVFWVTVLVSWAVVMLLRLDRTTLRSGEKFGWLFAGAAAAGVITWLGLAFAVQDWDSGYSWIMGPYAQLQASLRFDTDWKPPWWIYVRNMPYFGALMTVLIVPGIYMSLRGTRQQKLIAIAWLFFFVFMHLIRLREVRYLGVLAPLSACLIVPPLRALLSRPAPVLAVLACLVFDATRALPEAARLTNPFFTGSVINEFFEPIEVDGELRKPVLFFGDATLNFPEPVISPLAADHYHRVYHFGQIHIAEFFPYTADDLPVVSDRSNPWQAVWNNALWPDGTAMVSCTGLLANGASWTPRAPIGSESFHQSLSVLESIAVRPTSQNRLTTDTGQIVAVSIETATAASLADRDASTDNVGRGVILESPAIARLVKSSLFPRALIYAEKRLAPLRWIDDDHVEMLGVDRLPVITAEKPLVVRGFVIKRYVLAPGQTEPAPMTITRPVVPSVVE